MIAGLVSASPASADNGEAGGVEQWGNTEATFAADDGPWREVVTGRDGVLLAVTDSGTFDALSLGGQYGYLDPVPDDVVGSTVRAFDADSQYLAGVVLDDGSIRFWGYKSYISDETSTLSPSDLVAEAVDIAAGNQLSLIRLQNGEVIAVAKGKNEGPIKDPDTGETITNAAAVNAAQEFGYILREDGSVVGIDGSSGDVVTATSVPADADDPIEMMAGGIQIVSGTTYLAGRGVRRSGEIVKFSPNKHSGEADGQAPDASSLDGEVAQIVGQGQTKGWAVSTTTGHVVTWGDDVDPLSEEHQGQVAYLAGGGGNFAAVIPGLEGEDGDGGNGDGDGPVEIEASIKDTPEPKVGNTIEADVSVTGEPDEVMYEWMNTSGDELGTDISLKLTPSMEGMQILFSATPVVDGKEGVPAYAGPVTVKPADDDGGGSDEAISNTASPKISGTEQVGQTLSTDGGEWEPSDVDLAYQWLRDGNEISGATEESYKLTGADEGHKISVMVTAKKDGYESDSATSSETGKIKAADKGGGDNGDGDGDNGDKGGAGEGPSEPDKGAKDKQGDISVLPSTTLHPGQDFAVKFDDDLAGEKVSIWMFSEKFDLGKHTVGKNGRVSATVPEDISLGAHKVAAYDADGDLIGWVNVKVVAEQAAGPGTSAGGVAGALPSTGSEWLTNVLAPAGVLLLLAGGGALLVSRRRRHA